MVELLFILLGLIFFALALCISLSLAALRQIRLPPPPVLVAGMPLPPLRVRAWGQQTTHDLPAHPMVLLFLQSGCPKCKSKLPQIENLLPLTHSAGVELLLMSMESRWRLRHFFCPALWPQVRHLRRRDYLQLNPLLQSPMYLFINHQSEIEATGTIGDENWQAFCEQLQESAPASLEPTQ